MPPISAILKVCLLQFLFYQMCFKVHSANQVSYYLLLQIFRVAAYTVIGKLESIDAGRISEFLFFVVTMKKSVILVKYFLLE